jgi:hypothetical protein
MVTPFITDMGERPKMRNTATGEMMELDQYGYWCDMGKGKPEVKETSNDLEYLKTKYKVPDDRVFGMKQLKEAHGPRDKQVLVDIESAAQKEYSVYRVVYEFDTQYDLPEFVEWFKKDKSLLYPRAVQFVSEDTGETIKGPKYDTTTQEPNRWDITQLLKKKGIKQKPPTEPMQYEPRDRFDEWGNKPKYRNQIVVSKKLLGGYSIIAYGADGKIAGNGVANFTVDTPKKAVLTTKHLHDRYRWPIVNLTTEKITKISSCKMCVSEFSNDEELLTHLHKVHQVPDNEILNNGSWVDVTELISNHPYLRQYLSNKIKPMNEIIKFRNMIRECISEIKKENDPRMRLKESLRNVVKDVLNEMSTLTSSGKPDQTKDEKEISDKQYFKDPNPRLSKTNVKQQTELDTLVKGIDPSWEAYWDDHQQLIVRAQNLLYVRITQRFENNYDVDAMVKLVDRVRAIALTWDQVKDFIKANFSDLKNKTIPDKQREKALSNYDDKEVIKKDAGPEKAKVGVRYQDPKHGSVKDTKQDDKNYNEPQTKRDEDMPDQPMKQVTEPGKDPESKNKNITKTPQVKPPKHKNDKKLRVPEKKTSKFVLKKRP